MDTSFLGIPNGFYFSAFIIFVGFCSHFHHFIAIHLEFESHRIDCVKYNSVSNVA